MCRMLSRTLKLAVLAVALGTLLAGCASTTRFQTAAAACAGFEPPEYQIKGKTPYDQNWADDNTEVGIAGCGWARPKPRPASLDMPTKAPKKHRVVVRPATGRSVVPAPGRSAVPVPPSAVPADPAAPDVKPLTRRQKIINKLKTDIKKLKDKLRRYQPHDKLF